VDRNGLTKDSLIDTNYNLFILDDILWDLLYVIKVWIDNDSIVKLHYIDNRNNNLIKYYNINEVNFDNYILKDESYNKFHRYWNNANWNVKYLWVEWNQEIIYNNNTNSFDYSDLNWATYNYWTNLITHTILDIVPYYIFWNSPNDPTSFIDRILQTFK
jgi:hypothetical protein